MGMELVPLGDHFFPTIVSASNHLGHVGGEGPELSSCLPGILIG